MKALFFSLAVAAMMTLVTGAACFLLNLAYVNCFHVPIEALTVVVFASKTASCVFFLAVPFAIGSRRILERKEIIIPFRQFIITLAVGTFLVILILAIIFPCDTKPYFVGGYLIQRWFGIGQ